MDLRPYLALLEEKAPEQKSELMRIQLREYMEFVRSFSEQQNIMTKSFYIIVPYSPHMSAAETVSFLSHLPGRGKAPVQNAATSASFEEDRVQLQQRLSLVAGGLAS